MYAVSANRHFPDAVTCVQYQFRRPAIAVHSQLNLAVTCPHALHICRAARVLHYTIELDLQVRASNGYILAWCEREAFTNRNGIEGTVWGRESAPARQRDRAKHTLQH